MERQTYFHRTGRRKSAVAQVRILPGGDAIVVNGSPYEERFPNLVHRKTIMKPFTVTEMLGKYSVTVNEDHLILDGTIQRLLEPLLLASGFTEIQISEYFKEWLDELKQKADLKIIIQE